MTTQTFPCTRCAGKGRLPQHGNVLGGTCFKCHGHKTQATKPAAKAAKWAVFGRERGTQTWARLYNVNATSDDKALASGRTAYQRANSDWQAQYEAPTRAIRWDAMTDVTALTWDDATAEATA